MRLRGTGGKSRLISRLRGGRLLSHGEKHDGEHDAEANEQRGPKHAEPDELLADVRAARRDPLLLDGLEHPHLTTTGGERA